MRTSSVYIGISLFLIIAGIVIIFPRNVRYSAAGASLSAEGVVLEIPSSGVAYAAATSAATTPHIPKPASPPKKLVAAPPGYPTQLVIPRIALDSPVDPVGTNSKGEMAVPSGSTNHVGWYKGGVVPGKVGTAVMDAHVFAAFSRLDELRAGDDVYVETAGGTQLHFRVTAVQTYALSELTPSMLFEKTSRRNLNLITCAGELTPDRSTYDHRLIVYTELVP